MSQDRFGLANLHIEKKLLNEIDIHIIIGAFTSTKLEIK